MADAKLQSLIDRVIGKDGILRAPSYWMRRLFNEVIGYAEDLINKKTDIYILQAGEYALNSETGKKLLEILNNPDKYILQSWVDDSSGKTLIGCNASIYGDSAGSHIMLKGYAMLTSTHTVNGKLAEVGFTDYMGFIVKNDDTITVSFFDAKESVPFGKGFDNKMSDNSEYTVSNKVIKAYVDEAVRNVGAEVVDNLESESTTAALSANMGRELKEMIGLSGGNVIRHLYVVMDGMQYTDEQKAYNVETYNMLNSGEMIMLHTNLILLPLRGSRSDGAYIFSYLDIVVGGGKEQLAYQELLLYSDGTISFNLKSYNITSLKQ